MRDSFERMEALGRRGFIVSICCGPCGCPLTGHRRHVPQWTVNVLSPAGHEFDRPFGALSFDHAIEIAETEILRRGWMRGLTADGFYT
jgi:hypothetical protein